MITINKRLSEHSQLNGRHTHSHLNDFHFYLHHCNCNHRLIIIANDRSRLRLPNGPDLELNKITCRMENFRLNVTEFCSNESSINADPPTSAVFSYICWSSTCLSLSVSLIARHGDGNDTLRGRKVSISTHGVCFVKSFKDHVQFSCLMSGFRYSVCGGEKRVVAVSKEQRYLTIVTEFEYFSAYPDSSS